MSTLRDEIGLQCLFCGQMQLPPKRDKLDNWTCGNCYSGFLSFSMLTNLLPRDLVEQIVHAPRDSRPARPCCQCHRPMDRVRTGDAADPVELERCAHCHLIWFDSGAIVKLLRLRDPAEIIEQIARMTRQTIRPEMRPREPESARAPQPLGLPIATLGIFLASTVLYHDSARHWVLPLVAMSFYVERRARTFRYTRLFSLCWLAGQLTYLFCRATPAVPFGTSEALCGVAVYGLQLLPLRELGAAGERWRSSRTAIWWWVGAGFCVSLFLGWDFFMMAFRKVALGQEAAEADGTRVAALHAFLQTAGFRAHLVAGTLGLFWGMMETDRVDTKKT